MNGSGNTNAAGDAVLDPAPAARQTNLQDVYIETNTVYENVTLTPDHNLTVRKGAVLVLVNSTIFMDTYEFYRWIYVEPDAKLTMINSTISKLTNEDNNLGFGYFLIIYGELRMTASDIMLSGSLIQGDIYEVEASGIEIKDGQLLMENSSLIENDVVRLVDSYLTAVNSTFARNWIGFELENIVADISNCNFSENFVGISITDSEGYRIIDCTFYGSDEIYSYRRGIAIENSLGTIEGCTFDNLYLGISITEYQKGGVISDIIVGYGNEHYIRDCSFYRVGGLFEDYVISSFSGKIYLDNISISYPAEELLDYEWTYTNALNFQFARVVINDLRLSDYLTGGGFYHSDVVMTDSIINDSFYALDLSMIVEDDEVGFTADNITLTGNEKGMVVNSYDVKIKNSVIDSNLIGIESEYGVIELENNFIFNNSGWGIVATGTEVDYKGENFRAPMGWPVGKPANGMGNLLNLRDIKVYVKTTDDRPLAMFTVNVSNEYLSLIKSEHGFNYNYEGQTDQAGSAPLGRFIEYLILDGSEKIMVNDYTLRASYSTHPGFIYENVTNIKLSDIAGDNLTLRVALPNVYIVQEELVLDPEEVKPGKTVTIRATVHYTGPPDLVVPDFNVSLYISNTLIQVFRVEDLSTANPTKEVVFNWKAEGGGVSMPNNVISRLVRVELEPPEGMEYTYLTTEYIDDNTASAYVGLKIDFESDDVWISGSLADAFALCCALIIGIALIIGGVWIIHYRRLPEEKKEEMRKRREEKRKKKLERKKMMMELHMTRRMTKIEKRAILKGEKGAERIKSLKHRLKEEKIREKMEKMRKKRGGMDRRTEKQVEMIQKKMHKEMDEERIEHGEVDATEPASELKVKTLEDEDVGELKIDEPPAEVEITKLDDMAQLDVDSGGPPAALGETPVDAKTPPPKAIPSPEDTRIKKRKKRKH